MKKIYTCSFAIFITFGLLWFSPTAIAQGGVLSVNGSINGNLTSSTPDVYTVTITADGLLRFKFTTVSPADLYLKLYDNNGTTAVSGAVESYSNSTVVLTVDGLAAGTYKAIITPYGTSYGAYTLSDSLFTSALANDAEPNGTRATALTLPQNGNKTGHLGYYYNNLRDTADWYKVTTTQDGLLRITLSTQRSSVYSSNTLDQYITLYDNDGTTQLGRTEVYNNANPAVGSLSVDGLAAGTYYIKLQSYDVNAEFADYTISDSIFTSALASDAEPNGTSATALTLPQNGNKTGHLGFYYNHLRDSTDWYKVTTTQDGLLRVTLSTQRSSIYSSNTIDQYIILYDNDGSTQLGKTEVYNNANPAVGSLSVDGLAAGTYYIKLQSYDVNAEFADYTISDSLLTYNANDNEPDDSAYEATTIPANRTTTGHISFYFNGGVKKDYSDYHKINYTGTGNLQLTFNLLPRLSNGTLSDVFFQVFKDTSAAPIFNKEYYTTPTNVISLTGLTQGYYYIKVLPYSSNPAFFTAYSITDSFTQVNIATISLSKATSSATVCGSDSLTFSLGASQSPYTVRLYRDGILFDSLVTVTNSAVFTGLNDGNYYATAYGDGATGSAYSKTGSTQFLPPTPSGLSASNVTARMATLNFSALSCAQHYVVQYKVTGSNTYTTINTTLNTNGMFTLTGLTPSTSYTYRIASLDSANLLMGAYSNTATFMTLSALPVSLVTFDGALVNSQALLKWSTSSEFNNKGFEIQKSIDGQTFTDIGFVNSAGNSSSLTNYSFTDAQSANGSVYYRLKQIDFDDNYTFSKIIKIDFSKEIVVKITPNPAHDFININTSSVIKEVKLISLNGQLIKTWTNVTGTEKLDISNAAAGVYILKIITADNVQSQKIVKE